MLNFGASKPRVRGGPGPRGPPLDPHLLHVHLEMHWQLVIYYSTLSKTEYFSFDASKSDAETKTVWVDLCIRPDELQVNRQDKSRVK